MGDAIVCKATEFNNYHHNIYRSKNSSRIIPSPYKILFMKIVITCVGSRFKGQPDIERVGKGEVEPMCWF